MQAEAFPLLIFLAFPEHLLQTTCGPFAGPTGTSLTEKPLHSRPPASALEASAMRTACEELDEDLGGPGGVQECLGVKGLLRVSSWDPLFLFQAGRPIQKAESQRPVME